MECAWLRLAVVAVASITPVGSAAFGQVVPNVPGAVGQPPQRPERPEERPPAAVQAEDYSVKGIPVGGFRLFVDLEADQIFNDNIYALTFSGASAPAKRATSTLMPVNSEVMKTITMMMICHATPIAAFPV